MKKFSLIIVLLICTNLILAESILRDVWLVQSDKAVDSISSKVCIVTGKVINAFSEQGVPDGVISNLDRSSHTVSKADGTYYLKLSAKDTAIFFYHPQYQEIVCWKYDFKGGHHVVMNFLTSEKLPDGMMYMEEKPVIYAYSEQELTASIKLSNASDLTFTYPAYENGWNVKVSSKGIENNGTNLPYLFWEGSSDNLEFKTTDGIYSGAHINTDSSISYLQNTLAQIGLNSIEQTDFITYWGPRIQRYKYATIQFLVDEEYDNTICQLLVEPKPDAVKRVYLLFEGSNSENPKYVMQSKNFEGFERKGFTLIEWGGTEFLSEKKL
jgi:hypothetical protein